MEVTALCIRLMLNVLLLLDEHSLHSCALKRDAVFPHVFPTRLQFFEYESVSFTCEEFNDSVKWRGVRNEEEFIPTCTDNRVTGTVNCTIYNAFETDSGGYWCETGGGQRSNSVNITVTDGSVILECPAPPVMEGDDVTLSCRSRKTSSNLTADFFKDGLRIWTGSSQKVIIPSVSRSDEGLYKCEISGAGESAESRLTVTQHEEAGAVILESPVLPVMEGDSVSLRCRNKTSSTSLPAVFYKDGLFIGTSSSGNMTIHFVFKSHEGLYRCSISGAGESAESRLTVTALHREACPFSDHFLQLLLLVRTASTVVMVALLLLLVCLLHCGKLGGTRNKGRDQKRGKT
ncbi:high affinity immunoglobulin gamma Fc receptor I-like [Lates japonicus]